MIWTKTTALSQTALASPFDPTSPRARGKVKNKEFGGSKFC